MGLLSSADEKMGKKERPSTRKRPVTGTACTGPDCVYQYQAQRTHLCLVEPLLAAEETMKQYETSESSDGVLNMNDSTRKSTALAY